MPSSRTVRTKQSHMPVYATARPPSACSDCAPAQPLICAAAAPRNPAARRARRCAALQACAGARNTRQICRQDVTVLCEDVCRTSRASGAAPPGHARPAPARSHPAQAAAFPAARLHAPAHDVQRVRDCLARRPRHSAARQPRHHAQLTLVVQFCARARRCPLTQWWIFASPAHTRFT
jgi:hypothetical protein